MKIVEKDVVSVVKYGVPGAFWVFVSPIEDAERGHLGLWVGADGGEVCYRHWLKVTGIKLTVRKPVRVQISAKIVPTP